MNFSDELEFSAVDVSKSILDDIKTEVGPTFRDESGRYPFTAQVVSGIEAA
jgi:hypothetical protein